MFGEVFNVLNTANLVQHDGNIANPAGFAQPGVAVHTGFRLRRPESVSVGNEGEFLGLEDFVRIRVWKVLQRLELDGKEMTNDEARMTKTEIRMSNAELEVRHSRECGISWAFVIRGSVGHWCQPTPPGSSCGGAVPSSVDRNEGWRTGDLS